MNDEQFQKMKSGSGFIAALDQSGGSTPKALELYGIPESAYSNDDEMFALMHEMRSRIITSPAFDGDRILGAILFEGTMDRTDRGPGLAPVPVECEGRGAVPQGRQGSGCRRGRRAGHEADPRPRSTAGQSQAEGRVRHEDALLHQAGQSGGREGRRRPAVRAGPSDRGVRAHADHRAGGRHPQPGQVRSRGLAQGRHRGAAGIASAPASRSC